MISEISKPALHIVPNNQAPADVVDIKPGSSISAQKATDTVETGGNSSIVTESVSEETVVQLNQIVQSIQRELQFTINENSGETVITVVDRQTSEVIRQIPSEEILMIRENLESLKGVIFSSKA